MPCACSSFQFCVRIEEKQTFHAISAKRNVSCLHVRARLFEIVADKVKEIFITKQQIIPNLTIFAPTARSKLRLRRYLAISQIEIDCIEIEISKISFISMKIKIKWQTLHCSEVCLNVNSPLRKT